MMRPTEQSQVTGRPFIKMHGLRNHFVIVDARDADFSPSVADTVRICDPQVGVGADQLIVIKPSAKAVAYMQILNTDGREVEACGNASRCVAWMLMQETHTDAVDIETMAGVLRCTRAGDELVRCVMGKVRRDWRDIPLSRDCDTLHLPISYGLLQDPVACNVGNPHAVFFVESIDAVDIPALAPAIQHDVLFPQQVNVGVAQLTGGSRLRLVVYERGAGLTMACGSGACAAVYAARERGLVDRKEMTVELPGGEVEISIEDDDTAVMTGPVAYSFTGML